MSNLLEVGDRVIVNKESNHYEEMEDREGNVGVIQEVDDGDENAPYLVNWDEDEDTEWYGADDIILHTGIKSDYEIYS